MKPSNTPMLIVVALASAVVGGIVGYALSQSRVQNGGMMGRAPTTFEECAAAGNPVMESYPRQCKAGGKTFVEKVAPPTAPPTGDPRAKPGCQIGGCSQTICTEASAESPISTCIYKAEFACYKTATCEIQTNGKCGWTQTTALKSCIQNPPPLQ